MYSSLRTIYHKYRRFKDFISTKCFRIKMILLEYLDVLSKRSIYKHIVLSKEQKQSINEFWKKYYGKKVLYNWHRLYTALYGEFSIEYIPEYIYSAYLEPDFIKYDLCKTYADKCLLDVLYNNVVTPKTIAFNASGYLYDCNHRLITEKEFEEIINKCKEFVIKPTLDSGSGRNVRFVKLEEGIDKKSNEPISNILKKYKLNYIVQEKLEQNIVYSNLYPYSINTLRIITYIVDSKVKYMKPFVRVGTNGSTLDNWHYGGIAIGTDFEGKLCEYGLNDKGERFYKHPNTDVVFSGYKLSMVKESLNAAAKLHELIPHAKMISWDFMINQYEQVVLIEANYKYQGIRTNQICHGTLFGEDTIPVLKEYTRNRR